MNKPLLRIVQVALILTFFSFTSIQDAPEWKIGKSHSKIGFSVNHFFTPVEGYFNDYEGSLKFDPENLAGSSANFNVKVASVNTDNEKRDSDLKSDSFFNVEKFPEMKFTSTGFSKTDEGYVVKGNLTVKDVTKPVEVPFQVLGVGPNPWKKNSLIMGIKGSFKINRNDYGVGTGNWAATAVVGGEVTINVLLELNRDE